MGSLTFSSNSEASQARFRSSISSRVIFKWQRMVSKPPPPPLQASPSYISFWHHCGSALIDGFKCLEMSQSIFERGRRGTPAGLQNLIRPLPLRWRWRSGRMELDVVAPEMKILDAAEMSREHFSVVICRLEMQKSNSLMPSRDYSRQIVQWFLMLLNVLQPSESLYSLQNPYTAFYSLKKPLGAS